MEHITANEYIEQIKNNPTVQKWLNQFKYGNKEKFIEEYVQLKYKLISTPPQENSKDYFRSRYIEIAEKALEAILAKKIFDLELRWRAKEITIEGVAISNDIDRWLYSPVNCPFAPEITEEDIELMKTFLLLPDFEEYKLSEHVGCWHDSLRKELKSTEDKQHWFKFYNTYVSNPTPIDLPDIKGAKEQYYMDMHHKFNAEKNAKSKAKNDIYTRLESKEYDRLKIKLVEAAGFKDFANFLKDKSYFYEGENPIDPDFAWSYLNIHYDSKIPLRTNTNWAKALDLAYEQHAARHAAEHLQTVLETYQIRKENNIKQEDNFASFEAIANNYRKIYLETREKLGEPRNLDY